VSDSVVKSFFRYHRKIYVILTESVIPQIRLKKPSNTTRSCFVENLKREPDTRRHDFASRRIVCQGKCSALTSLVSDTLCLLPYQPTAQPPGLNSLLIATQRQGHDFDRKGYAP
jgi:hypothetical protein